jgi:hypothetical protein
MRWYFSLPGPVAGAAAMAESAPFVFTVRFSSGLTPKNHRCRNSNELLRFCQE